MPVNSPDVPPKLRRIGILIPLFVAIFVVAAAFLFAMAHLAVKGPGATTEVTKQQVATGQVPPDRGPYTLKVFSEPKNR